MPASRNPASNSASGSVGETTAASEPAQSADAVSPKALAYAKQLGGWDHKGQTLNLIVGGRFASEAEAQAALDKATPLFGDMQSYFVVQRSSSFAGMKSGPWVLVEAYFKPPSEENLDLARRAFPNATVEQARVTVTAPIPVYEDIVGGD